MVSRLTWLLRRLEAEPLEWAPEEAGPALLGTLAHEVFEGLFAPGVALPEREEIPERVEALVEEALQADGAVPARVVVDRGATALHRADDQGGAGVARGAGRARRRGGGRGGVAGGSVVRHCRARADGSDSRAAGRAAAGGGLQALEVDRSA